MTTMVDLRAGACPIVVSAQGGMAVVVSLTGITVTGASDWEVVIRHKASDTATVVAATVTADVIANSVTFALTSTQIATVIASGEQSWAGFWYLRNVSSDRVILSGTFKIDRARPATSSVGAVAVTVTTSTINVEMLTAVDPSTLSAVAAASAVRERRQGNLQAMRSYHAGLGKRTIQPCDIVLQGDSIMEGWTSGNTAGVTNQDGMFGEAQRQMAQIFNTHGYHGLWIPGGSGWFPNTRWSNEPNADREANFGISLRARIMQPGDAPATVTQTCDRIRLHYRKRNFLTGTMIVKIDGATVLTVDTFDGSLPAFASQVYEFDSGPLTRGAHTLSVEQSSGGLAYSVLFDGAYFCDGDAATGVRLWNASHFGYATLQYTQNTNWTDALSRGYIKPSLVVLALGSNESQSSTWYSQTSTLIDNIWAAADTGGYPRPSIAIFTQPAAGTRTEAVNEQYRTYAYALALSKVDTTGVAGVDVWEWNEFQGGVSTTTGDPLAITADNVHPRGFEHRVLGEFLVSKMLENQSGMAGIIELQRQIDAGLTGGGFSLTPTAIKTGAYTAAPGDLVLCDTTSGTVPITLPTAPANASIIEVKMVTQGGTNTVTIARGGTDVFNKAGSTGPLTISLLNQAMLLMYYGGVWYVLADDLTLTSLDQRFAPITGIPESAVTGLVADLAAKLSAVTAAGTYATLAPPVVAFTGDHTAALTDIGKVIEITNGDLTIPTNASVAFPVGQTLEVLDCGATSAVNVVNAAGVQVQARGGKFTSAGQYASIVLRQRSVDVWHVAGDTVAFAPDTVSGLVFWFKGGGSYWQDSGRTTAASADGDPVGAWGDSSIAANHATTATAGFRPLLKTGANGINGVSVLRFDGSDDNLVSAAATSTKPFTLFAVCKPTSFAAARAVVGSSAAGGMSAVLATSGKQDLLKSGTALVAESTTAFSAGAAALVEISYSGTGGYVFYKAGTADGSGTNSQTFTSLSTVLGRDPGGGGNSMLGDIAEVIKYDSVLTANQTQAVENYLGSKYGIAVS